MVSHGNYDTLSSDHVMVLKTPHHPFGLVKRAFETLTPEGLENYLHNFGDLDTRQDSEDFLNYLKTNAEGRAKLSTYRSRRRSWELLWKPKERQSFTKLMHKVYPEEHYNNTSNELEILD